MISDDIKLKGKKERKDFSFYFEEKGKNLFYFCYVIELFIW